MIDKEFYSVREVARILGLSPDRIYEYLRAGRLHGMRITEHSAWRIPASELARLKGGRSAVSESLAKPSKLADYLEIAAQLRSSLSKISPKDWAIWGLPDTGKPPLTSEAGLSIWIDRGKLVISLALENNDRFPLFISRLKAIFPEFKDYDRWRESLVELVSMCWTLAHEIWSKAENETGLELSAIPVMGRGHLLNVPKFIYEFALDNHNSGKQPDLMVLEHGSDRFRLVLKDQPDYVLAVGSMDEMQRCQDVTTSLAKRYASDGRIGDINAKALQVKKQSAPLQAVLLRLISGATSEN